MTDTRSIFVAAILAGVALVVHQRPSLAQGTAGTAETREVEVISADELETDEVQEIRRLVGNVELLQETTRLKADRAIQYRKRNLIVFDGGVEVIDEGDTLRAEHIEYRTDTKIANGSGGVVWTDGEVVLTAPSGEYQVDDKIASFAGDVVMRDSNSVITSNEGVYRVDDEVAFFFDTVRLDQELLVLTADSLTHERQTGVTTASGSVRIFQIPSDTAESRVLLLAGRAESDREAKVNRLWDDPILARVGSGGKGDTLVVSANRLSAARSDSSESFEAVGEARLWRPDLSGIADSLSYFSATASDSGRVDFTGEPVLWSGEAQVSGDSIRVLLVNGSPDTLTSKGSAFVAFEDTASGRIQQIRGAALVATFRSDSLRSLVVSPQAEALYFGDENSKKPSSGEESAVRFGSSSIRLDFQAGKVEKIVASTDVSGEITKFAPDNPPALDGFRWLTPTRPDRQNMLAERLLEALAGWPSGTRPN